MKFSKLFLLKQHFSSIKKVSNSDTCDVTEQIDSSIELLKKLGITETSPVGKELISFFEQQLPEYINYTPMESNVDENESSVPFVVEQSKFDTLVFQYQSLYYIFHNELGEIDTEPSIENFNALIDEYNLLRSIYDFYYNSS